jgi:outer membrane protein
MIPRLALLLGVWLAPALAAAQVAPPAVPPTAAPRRVIRLDDALAAARAHQPQLRQAQAEARAADARAAEARGVILPQLNLAASLTRGTSNTAGRTSIPGVSAAPANTWSGQLTASQVLFDYQAINTYRAAGATAAASEATERAAELDVDSGVRAAFFTARAQRDLVRVAQETVTNDEAHLRQVQGFVDVGTQPAIALAQTRAQLAGARLQLIQADNAYATARSQLLQAMGEPGSLDFDVADDTLPPVQGEEGPVDPLVDEAIAARPELASLFQQRRSEELTRSAAQGGYLPALSALATATDSGPRPSDTATNWTAGLALSWNLFTGGATRARVQEAQANLDSIQAQEDALRLSIRVAVEQAALGVRAALASVTAADDGLVNAREQLRLAEGRFQAGAGSIIELGDAQVAASTAGATRVQAEYNLASARAALLRALGRR